MATSPPRGIITSLVAKRQEVKDKIKDKRKSPLTVFDEEDILEKSRLDICQSLKN